MRAPRRLPTCLAPTTHSEPPTPAFVGGLRGGPWAQCMCPVARKARLLGRGSGMSPAGPGPFSRGWWLRPGHGGSRSQFPAVACLPPSPAHLWPRSLGHSFVHCRSFAKTNSNCSGTPCAVHRARPPRRAPGPPLPHPRAGPARSVSRGGSGSESDSPTKVERTSLAGKVGTTSQWPPQRRCDGT